ncbi:hypothetical protein RRG08_010367 [Elysia crispata]|uniref:Uncharacterized protein n=1 Tax=Elysia crispata TaxID=231223 RepID=A0AAE0Z2W2_9GAST|nr:hypothetical protein RRG08_010367 [Elysia crispata]
MSRHICRAEFRGVVSPLNRNQVLCLPEVSTEIGLEVRQVLMVHALSRTVRCLLTSWFTCVTASESPAWLDL